MKRTVSLVFVVVLSIPCVGAAARPDTDLRTPAVASLSPLSTLWNWLSAGLPWLTGLAEPSPAASAKELPPPPPPRVQPMNSTCIDPDGARVPCAPQF